MKKIIFLFFCIFFGLCFTVTDLLSASDYEAADVYVCETSRETAEIFAKTIAGITNMQRASYCKCGQVHESFRDQVKKGKWVREGYEFEYGSCTAPKNKVFRCSCVGRTIE